jgi:hypothetical protein
MPNQRGMERREMPRFEMQLPVEINLGAERGIASAVTRDVSARGVYIVLEIELSPQSDIEFTLTLPPEVTMTKSIKVRCNGHVLRVLRHGSDQYGVAANIHHYEFMTNGAKVMTN